ncbi:MAG: hypothetical protein B7Z10_12120 [Rhodobacterales bacterium 32-66-7]|nr:MAG: hypothetical protein B7Z10_12120 [Rhodobacterales bacterium 32-66-7]
MPPDPHALFQLTGPLALMGWLALALFPLAPRLSQAVAALAIPALLSVGYTALILVHWSEAPGGFGSLAEVMALFTDPWIALAGWVHYLAFDLFVGAWITRTARAEGIAHLLILPCLVLTFLFGPAGFLAFTALRAAYAARARMQGVPA